MAYFDITDVTSNSIIVDVYGISSFRPWFYYLIYKGTQLIDESPYTTDDTYVFSGLQSNQTYTILVKNSDAEQGPYSNLNYKNTSDTQVNVTTSSGGGGGEDTWSYEESYTIDLSSESPSFSRTYTTPGIKEGTMFTFNFLEIGTLNVQCSRFYGGAPISYFGNQNYGYDSSTGEPDSYNDSDQGSFSYSYTVNNQYEECYLWIITENNRSEFTLNISFTSSPSPTAPTYDVDIYNSNQITFTVYNRENYYLRFYVKQQSTNILVYDSNDDYGLISNSTFTTPVSANLNYNTTYIVNVGYYDGPSATYDHEEKIGQQIITTLSQGFLYELNSAITVSNVEVSTPIFCDVNKGVIIPITINQSGTITLYTQTSGQSTIDDIGYLTTSSNIPYDSNGVVDNTSSYYVTYNDDFDANNREFKIIGSVTGPNTYYLFIRSYDITITMSTVLYASLATTPSTDSYVYIYTGQGPTGWQKAIPYIYTGYGSENGWSKAEAYIYTNQGWKKCGE